MKGMTNMIGCVVTGNAGSDAVVRDGGGTPVLSFRMASRRFEKKEEVTDWIDVNFWGTRAEKLAQYVTKGSRIAVRGQLWQREYVHNGERRWSLTVRADDVELLGKPEGHARDAAGLTQQQEALAQQRMATQARVAPVQAAFGNDNADDMDF